MCTLQQEVAGEVTCALTQGGGPEVSMSCLPPDRPLAFGLAKTDESMILHLLSSGCAAGEKFYRHKLG